MGHIKFFALPQPASLARKRCQKISRRIQAELRSALQRGRLLSASHAEALLDSRRISGAGLCRRWGVSADPAAINVRERISWRPPKGKTTDEKPSSTIFDIQPVRRVTRKKSESPQVENEEVDSRAQDRADQNEREDHGDGRVLHPPRVEHGCKRC